MSTHRIVSAVEVLTLAARHLRATPRQIANRTDLRALARAVAEPAAVTGTGPLYPTATDKVAAIAGGLVREQPFREQNAAVATLAMTAQGALNHLIWSGGRLASSEQRVLQLRDHLDRISVDGGRDLSGFRSWVRGQMLHRAPRSIPPRPPEHQPGVFIGHPSEYALSTKGGPELMNNLSRLTQDALKAAPGALGFPWQANTLDPVLLQRGDDDTTWNRDFECLANQAHGFIGLGGIPSTGVAVNWGWARNLLVPSLHILPLEGPGGSVLLHEEPSTLSTIDYWDRPDDIYRVVENWLRFAGYLLDDGWRRAQNEDLAWLGDWAKAKGMWEGLSNDDQDHVLAVSLLSRAEVDLGLRSARTYRASAPTMVTLTEHLAGGSIFRRQVRYRPAASELSVVQRNALTAAGRSQGWSVDEMRSLEREALRIGAARNALKTPAQWIALHRAMRSGEQR